MFEVRSEDVSGFSKADSMLANELIRGAEDTLKRVHSAGSTPLAMGQLFEFAKLDAKAGEAYCKSFDDNNRGVAVEALARYVITLLKQDRRTDALNAANRLARIDPEYKITSVISGETYSSMTLLGEALVINERLEDAERAYRTALKTLPGDPFASGRLAMLLLATSKADEAVGLVEAASKSSRYADLTNTLELVRSGVIGPTFDRRAAVATVAGDAVGRPFRVEEPRIASLIERADWA